LTTILQAPPELNDTWKPDMSSSSWWIPPDARRPYVPSRLLLNTTDCLLTWWARESVQLAGALPSWYDWYGVLLDAGVREGVVMTDIDEKHNRILFGVEDAAGRQRLERQLARLDLPCFLVGVSVVGRRVPG
jgi:hypothetical protein